MQVMLINITTTSNDKNCWNASNANKYFYPYY